ncbi:MAG: argininosuccinate synthase [Phycisphaeraceae bacterium]|nr:argininosuccinate synthase [Phycisphaeraceae bacterium]MCB9848660.1 argininosuccinate synthase [Phycisphaeraceae bacterium]
MPETVVLAFSGGLDTSYCVLELLERGYRVVTLFVDTGGVSPEKAAWIERRALDLGAAEHHAVDGSVMLWDEFVVPFVMGGALYAGQYPLLCSDRTVIAAEVAALAEAIGADAVAHGCTAMGNDQVRFDLALRSLTALPILAPIRDLQGATSSPRAYEIERLGKAGFKVEQDASRYSINENLLGVTMSGSEIDRFEAPDGAMTRRMTAPRENWPAEPLRVTLTFEQGVLTSIDGERGPGPAMLHALNRHFGAYGVGRRIYTGDTVIGLKGRIVFEASGLTAMLTAHKALAETTMTKSQSSFAPLVAAKWSELVYSGLFHDPLRADLERFIRSTQRRVTGEVELHSDGGECLAVAVRSANTLTDPGAVYAQSADWTSTQAEGFIKLYGLSSATWSGLSRRRPVGIGGA